MADDSDDEQLEGNDEVLVMHPPEAASLVARHRLDRDDDECDDAVQAAIDCEDDVERDLRWAATRW
jgi:hypothetical protein